MSRAFFCRQRSGRSRLTRRRRRRGRRLRARRAAREPTYASTHAKVLRRVASAPFREKATEVTLQTLRRLALASPPSRRSVSDDIDAEGAAAFAAALTERETTGSACDQAERARVAVVAARSRGSRKPRGPARARRRSRSASPSSTARWRRAARTSSRRCARACARSRPRATMRIARRTIIGDDRSFSKAEHVREPNHSRSSRWIVRTIRRASGEPSVLETFPRLGDGIGRGRARSRRAARGPARARAVARRDARRRGGGRPAETPGRLGRTSPGLKNRRSESSRRGRRRRRAGHEADVGVSVRGERRRAARRALGALDAVRRSAVKRRYFRVLVARLLPRKYFRSRFSVYTASNPCSTTTPSATLAHAILPTRLSSPRSHGSRVRTRAPPPPRRGIAEPDARAAAGAGATPRRPGVFPREVPVRRVRAERPATEAHDTFLSTRASLPTRVSLPTRIRSEPSSRKNFVRPPSRVFF